MGRYVSARNNLQDVSALNGMSSLDVRTFARETKPLDKWDNLSVWEYTNYLKDGIHAAQESCENHASISTLDDVNAFPVLLVDRL